MVMSKGRLLYFFLLLVLLLVSCMLLYSLHGKEMYERGYVDGMFVDIPDVYVRSCVYMYMYPKTALPDLGMNVSLNYTGEDE